MSKKKYNFKNKKNYFEKYDVFFEKKDNKQNDNKNKSIKSETKNKISLKIKILICVFIFIILLLASYFIYRAYMQSEISKRINSNIQVEYGDKVLKTDILKDDFESVKFTPKLNSLKEVGKHKVSLFVNGFEFEVTVNIKDTVAPLLEVHDVQKYLDEGIPKVEEFIVKVEDLSDVDLKMSDILLNPGEQEVEITATDKFNNKTTKKVHLSFIEYKGSVKMNGLTSLSVYVNSKPDLLKGVTASDDRFGLLEVTADDSKVNYSKPGNYKIYYSAKDKLGNVTTWERKITVKERTVMIDNFPTYSQFPNYPNGCETISLYLMLKYYGVNVSPSTLVNNLAKGDGPYWEGNILYGADPEVEFVGDPRDQHGYGCYQKPIINLANKYKSGMVDYSGHSLSQVLEIVRSGKPVQVWVSINLRSTSVCASWTEKSSGKKIDWICNLHSVVIVGFNDNYVYASDPYTGKIEKYKRNTFQSRYNLFGKRAIYFS